MALKTGETEYWLFNQPVGAQPWESWGMLLIYLPLGNKSVRTSKLLCNRRALTNHRITVLNEKERTMTGKYKTLWSMSLLCCTGLGLCRRERSIWRKGMGYIVDFQYTRYRKLLSITRRFIYSMEREQLWTSSVKRYPTSLMLRIAWRCLLQVLGI